jgi:hypothetical protein
MRNKLADECPVDKAVELMNVRVSGQAFVDEPDLEGGGQQVNMLTEESALEAQVESEL